MSVIDSSLEGWRTSKINDGIYSRSERFVQRKKWRLTFMRLKLVVVVVVVVVLYSPNTDT